MELLETPEFGLTVLKISGEIDLHASPDLRAKLQAIASGGNPPLLLDMSEVEYIDSSGLATLIEHLNVSQGGQHRMAICGLQPKVNFVFEIVRLHKLFTLFPTVEEGRSYLNSSQAVK